MFLPVGALLDTQPGSLNCFTHGEAGSGRWVFCFWRLFRVNYNDLTATSLGIIVFFLGKSSPFMALIHVSQLVQFIYPDFDVHLALSVLLQFPQDKVDLCTLVRGNHNVLLHLLLERVSKNINCPDGIHMQVDCPSSHPSILNIHVYNVCYCLPQYNFRDLNRSFENMNGPRPHPFCITSSYPYDPCMVYLPTFGSFMGQM